MVLFDFLGSSAEVIELGHFFCGDRASKQVCISWQFDLYYQLVLFEAPKIRPMLTDCADALKTHVYMREHIHVWLWNWPRQMYRWRLLFRNPRVCVCTQS